jgi:2-dehydropantoate 2-reductase
MNACTVVGAGGIGCAVGHALCSAGIQVTFIEADAEKVCWGREHGVGVDHLPSQRAHFETFDHWSPDPQVPVLLCTKCYDNAAVLARLPATTLLIPIQNGFDTSLDARGTRPEGIASFVSECLPHRTHTRITRGGRLHLGMYRVGETAATHAEETLAGLAAWLHCAAPFRVTPVRDILPYKHTKLMYNAAIGPLAAAAGLDNGELLSVPLARRLFFRLLRENYAILHGAGLPLGKVGPFYPSTVERILRRRWVARALSWAFYPSLRGSYCSMHGDLPAGRTEIDYYNRYLIDLAGDRPCPLNRQVLALIKRMEQEQLAPCRDQLNELAEMV